MEKNHHFRDVECKVPKELSRKGIFPGAAQHYRREMPLPCRKRLAKSRKKPATPHKRR